MVLCSWLRKSETDDSEFFYGSCVGSKAAEARFGVAKNARLVVLKALVRGRCK